MSQPIWYLSVLVGGFLLGSFPTGVYLTRRKYHIDVREMGSGNIGATNVTRVFGWWAGFFTLLIDFIKGFLPLFILKPYLENAPWVLCTAGVALVAGHCFSVFLKFRGGKGVATGFGALSAIQPAAALASLIAYAFGLFTTRISAIGSLSAVFVAAIYAAVIEKDPSTRVFIFSICGLILFRHQSNIQRLLGDLTRRRDSGATQNPPKP